MSESLLFDKMQYSKASPQIVQLIDWIYYITQILTTIVFLLLTYIVCWHSPKKLHDYKWFIMINSTIGYFVIPVTNIVHFETMLPYNTIVIVHGIADLWIQLFGSMPPKKLIDSLFAFEYTFVICYAYSTTCMFIYRYLQTTKRSLYLLNLFCPKHYLKTYLVVFPFTYLLVYLHYAQLDSSEDLKKEIKEVDPLAYYVMKNHYVGGYFPKKGYNFEVGCVYIATLVFLFIFIVVYSTINCYKFLRLYSANLSPQTIKLYKSLLNALVLDGVFAIVNALVAIGTFVLLKFINSSNASEIFLISITIPAFYPLFNFMITLIYIEPYYLALLKLLRLKWLIDRRKRNSVQSIEVVPMN